MNPVNLNRILRLPFDTLKICPAVVIQLPVIDRIIQDIDDKVIGEGLFFTLADTRISVIVQPDCHTVQRPIILYVLIKDQPDDFRLCRFDLQFLVHAPVSVWSRSARPSTVQELLHLSRHELNIDVLTLDLGNRRQNCQSELSSRRGTVYGIFHADKIHFVIFQQLQRLQDIRSIPSES